MKTINSLFILYVLCLLTACNENALDSLSGKYAMDGYTFNKVENQTTDKLKKGVKAINMTLTDASGNSLALRLGSDEWILPAGTYVYANTVSAGKQYSATLNGNVNITAGDIDVAIINGQYLINGLLTTSTGQRFRFNYRGTTTFTVGVDDPEASGYTVIMSTSAVSVTDWTTGKTTNYPELTKYTFTVSDPNGQEVASLNAINKANANISEVTGTYTIQGSPTTSWLMDSGWVLSQYNMAGGSYYTDANKVKQYITAGKITISAVQGIEGDMLYSFSGSELTTSTNKDVLGTGTFNYKYANLSIKGN
ncbi:hypothetical protein SAMN05444405_10345 [Bacteroides luti]|uniref:Uncharacterized protein n=1 Tax=Bacteroides luti TaxID=1297750 RepID=A0A1M4WBY4_9BACE|nr:hypothetical protein [Bacteroides luti]SHE78739.1 hypothetical protein SAMN05444405_10345 [Bacteroides luti]